MVCHSVKTDEQSLADLGIAQPFTEEAQDFDLSPLSESGEGRRSDLPCAIRAWSSASLWLRR